MSYIMADVILSVVTRAEARARNLTRYFTGAACKHGHVAERYTRSTNCVVCQVEANRSERSIEARKRLAATDEYKRKAAKKSAQYHRENRAEVLEKMRARNAAYYEKHKDKIKAAAAAYQTENKAARNAYKTKWNADRKKTNPEFAALCMMRKLVARVVANAKNGTRQSTRTSERLGYSVAEFKAHIERQFVLGMTWANHGEWHIDHVIPLSTFDLTLDGWRKAANCLSNLRPIWAKENLAKADQIVTLL